MKALIVEDDPTNRKLLLTALNQFGTMALTAADGQDAYKYALEDFDIAFIDYWLPEETGDQVLARINSIRKESGMLALPACIVSSDENQIKEANYRASGFQDFLSKPFQLNVLSEKLKKIFETKYKDQVKTAYVLIIEDNYINACVLQNAIEQLGIKTVISANGSNISDEQLENACIAFIDYDLPGTNGLELLRKYKNFQVESGHKFPLICTSAFLNTRDGFDLSKSGFALYFQKPLNISALIKQIEPLLTGCNSEL